MASLDQNVKIALAEEAKTAIFLIRQGLISLKHLYNDVDSAHLPILLLSNGFERLVKTIICLSCLEKKPVDPDFGNIQIHNIKELLERVIETAKRWGYEKKCEDTKADMVFLDNCKDLQKLVKLLTNFGDKSGRYYNIDLIIGKKKKFENPSKLFIAYCDEKRGEGVSDIIRHVTTILQRFARALCRMFIYGELGQTGDDMKNIMEDFLCLNDKDLPA
ncbi:MAG: hypothetical protein ACYST9_00355 [Planctomycetota bacterium]|jgi:hypothetical protein